MTGLGFARVRFRFPPDTRFPSLPVRAGQYGLVYPLEGASWCTGFELAVALDQGAAIEVEHGVFVPWRSDVRPFAEFAAVIKELRDRHPKGSLMERLAKEMGNSLYGKVAQQVAAWRPSGGGRRVFDSRSGEMRDMPPSSITCAPIAAAVTGLVRATLSEILALMPAEHAGLLGHHRRPADDLPARGAAVRPGVEAVCQRPRDRRRHARDRRGKAPCRPRAGVEDPRRGHHRAPRP